MSTMTPAAEVRQVNGQVELADPAAITTSPYANDELVPVPLAGGPGPRTTTWPSGWG